MIRFLSFIVVALALFALPNDRAVAAAEIQEVTTPGGVTFWMVEERAIPILSIQIAFRGGASLERPEEQGLANLLTSTLDEGAGPYDAQAYAARAEEIAARIGFSSDRDTLRVSASMLIERRDETLELLRLALTEPRFDPEPLARVKAQIQSGLKQDEVDPDAMASNAWFSAKFPSDAYGRMASGTPETVEAFTAEDLRGIMPRLINRSDMYVGVVGAISAEEVAPLLDALLGDLPAGPPEGASGAPDAVTMTDRSGIEVIDFDAPQSTVLFGHDGPLRDDPDFIPAFVMNYILGGGGFASRLTVEVREKRGLAYGVYSYLAPLDRSGLYLGGVATANERVSDSIDVIRDEWRRMAEEGVSEEELDRAKRYLTGAYPLRFDSNGKIARFLVGAQLEDLPIDYIETRNELVEAVTVDDIKRVAAKWMDPNQLYFVVVGKPEGLASSSN
ncbi:MAG: pitrilysin family protein [Pseudomonadota bacterium]